MKIDRIDPNLEGALEALKDYPRRELQAAQNGRANFLAEAAKYRNSQQAKADSPRKILGLLPLFRPQALAPAWKPVMAVFLALILFFGASSATVYAAQSALPDQSLYALKIWSEDRLISLTSSAQTRLDYVLDFSDRRVSEMAGMLAAGKPIPPAVETRYQDQLGLALELAMGMQDLLATRQMPQIRQCAENQLRTLQQMMSEAPQSEQDLVRRASQRLQEQIRFASLGEIDLPELRVQIRQHLQANPDAGQSSPSMQNPSANPGMNGPTQMPGGSGMDTTPGPSMQTPSPNGVGNPDAGSDQSSGSGSGPDSGSGSSSGSMGPTKMPTSTGNGSGEGSGGSSGNGSGGNH